MGSWKFFDHAVATASTAAADRSTDAAIISKRGGHVTEKRNRT
jgi:hypothetical protein